MVYSRGSCLRRIVLQDLVRLLKVQIQVPGLHVANPLSLSLFFFLSFSSLPSFSFLCIVCDCLSFSVCSGTSTQEGTGRLENFSLNSLKTRIDHGHLDRITNIQMKWRNNEPKLFRFFAMQAFQTVNLVPFESVGTTKKGDLRSITP